jgi:hypothetical protein
MFFSAFTQPQQIMAAWQKMVDDHMQRMEALNRHVVEVETKGYERAAETIDECAKLMKASLDHSRELADAWRQHSVEMSKQAVRMVNPGA